MFLKSDVIIINLTESNDNFLSFTIRPISSVNDEFYNYSYNRFKKTIIKSMVIIIYLI